MRKPDCVGCAVAVAFAPLLAVVAAGAQEWDVPAEALAQKLAAVSAAAYPGADMVTVFDRRAVAVEESGLARMVGHTLAKALTPAGARALAVGEYSYDPLSAGIAVLRCRVFSAGGAARDVDPARAVDLPDPQSMIYWNSRHKLLAIGKIAPGDAVEVVTRRVGFTYALLAGEDAGDESRFVPPMRGHFYDIVPFWSSCPVIEQSYRVAIAPEKQLQYQIYNGSAEVSDRIEGDMRVVTVTMRDTKPLPSEPGMVAWSDVAPKLLLTTARDWRAKSLWFHSVQEEARCFEVTPELKKVADEVTAGLARDEDKVAALNHWAAENIRYIGLHMGEGEGYTLHPASMTLRDRGGVCKDKAGILVALLRAAGLESYPAMTMAGERIERLAADQFNHCVTVWRKPDTTTVLLDPTWIPGVREMWSSREQQQEVLMGLPEGADLLTTPISPPENHPLRVTIDSTLHSDGALEGRMQVASDGQADSAIRRMYRGKMRNEWPAVDRQWLAALDARAEVAGVERIDPDDLDRPFTIALSFRIPGYARRLDDGALLLVPLGPRHPVGAAVHADELRFSTGPGTRRFTAAIGCTRLVVLAERMELPAGFAVEGLPAAVKLEGNGALDAKWSVDGGALVIEETLAMRSRRVEPAEWPELRAALEAFRKLAATPILVRPARAGKEGA
ncbi:MAG TPA: transglutaminase [Planctomycetes bacterium]|nr:transglutaminase [Planctomycetota bacterium]